MHTTPPERSGNADPYEDPTVRQAAMLADASDPAQQDLILVANGLLTKVHPASECAGRNCWVHNPTPDWPLAGQPVYYRASTRVAYRPCAHDVLHPDIDSVAWSGRGVTKYAGREVGPSDPAWHPMCDGCCKPKVDGR